MRRFLLVFGLYLAVAVVVTYPLAFQLGDVLAGFVYGDGREMAHHLWWFGEALRRGESPFFMSNLAYPAGIDAITLWANPLQFFPAWLLALLLPPAAAANLTLLLTMALNGAAAAALCRALCLPTAGAAIPPITHPAPLIGGLVFMLFPTMQAHLGAGHAGLLVQYPLALYALALLRLRGGGGGRVLAAAALLMISGWGHTLQVIYASAPLTLLILLAALWRRDLRMAARIVGAAALGAAALAVYLLPAYGAALGGGYDEGGVVRYSADLLAFASPSFRHPVWGALLDYPARVLGVNLDEGAAYVGLIAGLLALIGVVRARAARVWLALALLAYALSLGGLLKVFDQPVQVETDGYLTYVALPWGLLAQLPPLNLLRTPGRFNFGLALAVAVMAGYGAGALFPAARRTGARFAAAAALMALIAFDYQVFFPLPTTPAAIPAAVRDLAGRADIRAVLGVPWDNLIAAKTDLYLHTAHQRPLLAGQVTRRTPVSPAMLSILQATFDPALLDAAGVDLVIVHRAHDDGGALYARAAAVLGAPIYADASLALFVPPDPGAPPAFAAMLPDDGAAGASAVFYVYAPEPGWARLETDAAADSRSAAFQLDGAPIAAAQIDGMARLWLPVPLEAGYSALALALEPPCPAILPSPALACRAVSLANSAAAFIPDSAFPPNGGAAAWGRGVTLARWRVLHDGGVVSAWLDWRFAEALTPDDIRFVHLLDADGALVAQSDQPLGALAAGTRRVEAVELALPPDRAAGTYTLAAGWYRYPEIARFPLLSAPTSGDLMVLGALELP